MSRLTILSAVSFAALAAGSAHASTTLKEEYEEFEQAEFAPIGGISGPSAASSALFSSPGSTYFAGFEGVSQYDVAAFSRNFVPPDTMGAIGRNNQYMVAVNGGVGVFNTLTGVGVKQSDTAFWLAAGQVGANGDTRVMFDSTQNRWVALAFASNTSMIQIAVSDTDNAAGTWHSTKFTGFSGFAGSNIADYPTMALDSHALYIGTNNFNTSANCGTGFQFCGTTLNVLPLASLFAAGGPTTANLVQFVTPLTSTSEDRGFAIQGVNTTAGSPTGTIISASLFTNDTVTYNVNFDSSGKATSQTAVQYLGTNNYDGNGPGRQPNATGTDTANGRVVDTLDSRISAAVFEKNGLIYSVYTATPVGGDHTSVRWVVTDAATKAVLDQGEISDGQHDYYQGSIAVNDRGQVVIAYNRSGSETTDANGDGLADGNISFMARVYSTNNGKLVQRSGELLLKASLVDDYHNGSLAGQNAAGRQRWGDYSAVNVDPSNNNNFWAIGEWAREYNNAAGGHPGGTGGSRWSTWVAGISTAGVAVPEPSTWMMLILGFGAVGSALRRRTRTTYRATLA